MASKPVLAVLLTVAAYALLTVAIYTGSRALVPGLGGVLSALFDAVLAAALMAVVLWLLVPRRFTGFEKVLLVAVWVLGGLASPSPARRCSTARSVAEAPAARWRRADAIPGIFVSEYMPEFRLVDVRLTEQLEAGTIVIANGCVKLTPKGERLAGISRFLRTNFLPKHRLLAGVHPTHWWTRS